MHGWTRAAILGAFILVIVTAIVWHATAVTGPRYDKEGLPTGPVGVAYVTHVPEYRLAYPGARILSDQNQGEVRYTGWLQPNTIDAAMSTVTSEAPAKQQQVLAWYI